MSSLLDLFGLKTKRIAHSDDIFLNAVKRHQDIWAEIFSDKMDCIVACPSSSALGEETITREYLMTHILLPERKAGEFANLYGQKVQLVGSEFHCGYGFSEQRKVKILLIETITDSKSQTVSVYRLNRPFVGGIASPEQPEEVTYSIMHKFVAILRAFPEAEAVFNSLDKYSQEVVFVGVQSADGFSKIKPSLKTSLEAQWLRCSERLCTNGTITAGLGSDPSMTKQIIGQVVESYIMSVVSPSVYQWICRQLVIENGIFLSSIAIMHSFTQSDLGIRPELQCSQHEAIRTMKSLSEALTPIDKLVVLKQTINKIREAVDRNVQSKFLNSDVELATDDIVSFVIWIIVKASKFYENIYYDIHFAADYHFVSSSKSDIGFCLNHFQVALSWIVSHGTYNPDSEDLKVTTFNVGSGLRRLGNGNLTLGLTASSANAIERLINTEKLQLSCGEDEFVYNSPVESLEGLAESLRDASPPRTALFRQGSIDSDINGFEILILSNSGCLEERSTLQIVSEESNKPVLISSIQGGPGYYSAIDTGGCLYTWGTPDCGRLGHNISIELDNFISLDRPTQVISIGQNIKIKRVACGDHHTLAVSENGEVYAWGDNRCAQLGISTSRTEKTFLTADANINAIMASEPVLVEAMKHERVTEVACGALHSLCLTNNGAIYSWGRAANGRLGQFSDHIIPEHAVGKPGPVRGPWQCLTVNLPQARNSRPTTPNSENFGGRPYRSMSDESISPITPSTISATFICAGYSHSVAITSRGEVYSWGCGSFGRLGHGSHIDYFVPKQIASFNRYGVDITSAACGAGHTLFLSKEGILFGCGWNKYKQLGITEISLCRSSYSMDKDCVLVPQPVTIRPTGEDIGEQEAFGIPPRFKLINKICCGSHISAAISKDKRLYVWGKGVSNNSDNGPIHVDKTGLITPKKISGAGPAIAVLF